MIEVNERIEVPAPPAEVWKLLSNPREVVECVPGASLGETNEDGSLEAVVVIKFGPAKVTFKSRAMLELDPATMTGEVSSKGRDNQGGTRFNAKMHFGVAEQTMDTQIPGSVIDIKATVEISGRLATLVEGGAKLVVKYMTSEFSKRLTEKLAVQVPK